LQFLTKALPLAYNRDLQEDKIALFAAFDTTAASLELAEPIAVQAELQRERIAARLEEGFLDATMLMEYLIGKGVPMRTAHEIVGKLVALCDSRKCRLSDLPLADLQTACDRIAADVSRVLGTTNAVAALRSFGSGGKEPVLAQIKFWKETLT
jgi:argininosuccinate lyase